MSGFNSRPELLTAPVTAYSEAVREHRAATPDVQADNLAYLGGMIVGAGASLAVNFAPHARDFSIALKIGFAAVMIWGVVLIVTGWRARGPRKIGGAIRAVVVPGIGFYLAVTYLPGVFHLWWAQAFCIGIIVANVMRVAICLAGPSSRAFDLVAEDIADNDWQW